MTATNKTAGRKADLIKARDEWDARNEDQKAKHEAQYSKYRAVENEILANIECQITSQLNEVDMPLDITSRADGFIHNQVTVSVSNEQHRDCGQALRWTFQVSGGKGCDIEKKTNSWSGLEATNAEQMESLEQTVRTLKILNSINWADLLDVELPVYAEYVTERSSIGERPKFEADIRAAEVAELIGTNTLIKGSNSSRRGYGASWYHIISESPKQFKVAEISDYNTDPDFLAQRGTTLAEVVEQAKVWAPSISKEKFVNSIVSNPIATIAF